MFCLRFIIIYSLSSQSHFTELILDTPVTRSAFSSVYSLQSKYSFISAIPIPPHNATIKEIGKIYV